jgi:hypothetical protein
VAFGYRVNEVPLDAVAVNADCVTVESITRRDRTVNFVCLDDEFRVCGLAPISTDFNDPYTVTQGFLKRIGRKLPKGNPNLMVEFGIFVKLWLLENVPSMTKTYTFQEWLDSTSYNDSRKMQLYHAFELNMHQGGMPTKNQCTRVESHGKREAYVEFKHLRTINSRPDRFKVWFGPLCKSMEKHLLHCCPYFVKGKTIQERMDMLESLSLLGRKYTYSTDFTAFESHFIKAIMAQCEFLLYEHLLSFKDAQFLESVLGGKNKMRMMNGNAATVIARRMSGEMNTSLANGFSNIMLALFIAKKQNGHLDGLVEGDDGLFVTDFELKNEHYLDLGFTIKITPEPSVNEASFCGLIFSKDRQLIKDPIRCLQKFSWSDGYFSARKTIHEQLLVAKAMSLLCECPDCPVVSFVAYKVLMKYKNVKPKFVQDGFHEFQELKNVRFPCPTPDTRLLFAAKYGVGLAEQEAAEQAALNGETNRILDFLYCPSSSQIGSKIEDSRTVSYNHNFEYELRYVVRV